MGESSWLVLVKIASIIAAITEARLYGTLSLRRVTRLEQALQDIYAEHLLSTIDMVDLLALKVYWHSAFLSLYSSFTILKKCLSKSVNELDEADRDYISQWAMSDAG